MKRVNQFRISSESSLTAIGRYTDITKTQWRHLDNNGSPFLSYEFLSALEKSHSVGKESGWDPIYIIDSKGSALYTYVKHHSYGEYIFDWEWANFYHQYGISYYPKLTSMIPFTSVTTKHFLGDEVEEVMDSYENLYLQNPFSSSHFLFITHEEIPFFQKRGYLIRDSFQYHFINQSYDSFDHFLSSLKQKKAKQIKKERLFDAEIEITKITKESLSEEYADEMYLFYLTTINQKNGVPYLSNDFFRQIFSMLKNSIYYIRATKKNRAVAGALFLYSHERLYGRYWGASEDIPNLHFELCYYQGIEICIEHKFSIFEAGAQGEHKISRGFRPVKTFSAHKFKHPQFHEAISKFISEERTYVEESILKLSERLPFR